MAKKIDVNSLIATEDEGLVDVNSLIDGNVKKKEYTSEDYEAAQTSLRGSSVAPPKLSSEAPSTTVKGDTTDIEEVKPTIESKILTDVDSWYEKRGGMTPEKKLATFDRISKAKKNQYTKNIQANPDKEAELINQYQTDIDELAYEYGIVKKEESYTIPEREIDLYKERVQESYSKYIKNLSKQAKSDPFMTKLAKRLDAGAERFLNIPVNTMAISEAITNAVSEKAGGGESTYWQDRAFYLSEKSTQKSQEAQVGEGEIVAALQAGDVGEAAGNLVLDMSEQIPQLLALWTGNAAGITNASLGLIGAQVGTEKFVQNKELGIPDWLNAINSITSAGIEVTFEAVGTVKIMDNIKRAIKTKGTDIAKDELSIILRTPIQKAYATVVGGVKDGVRESATEVATELSNQLVDHYTIDPSIQIGKGLADIAVTSFAIGNTLRTLGEVASPKTNKDFREAYSQVPNDYTASNKVDAAKLILEIDGLEKLSKGKNKILSIKSKERIKNLNDQLLSIAKIQDEATDISEQINELDKEIVFAEEQDKPIDKLEKQQEELIKQRDELLSRRVAEEVLKKEQQPKYSIDGIEYTNKEEFLKDVDKFSSKEGTPDIKVDNDDVVTKQVTDILEQKVSEKPLEVPESTQIEKTDETIPETKEAVKTDEIEKVDVRQQEEEVIEGVEKEKVTVEEKVKEATPKEQFKQDFLSDEANLNDIDIPLKMKDRIAARKNLIDGKETAQGKILEDYINQSFDKGGMDLVAIAAGGQSVKTTAPIESILKAEKISKPITEKVIEPMSEKPTDQVVPPIKEPESFKEFVEKKKTEKPVFVEEMTPTDAKKRVLGVEKGIFQANKSEQQQFVQTLIDANKETYDVLSYEAATENAKQYIAEQGSPENAYMALKEEKSNYDDAPTRQVARLALIDYFARKAVDENTSIDDQNTAIDRILDLEKVLAVEAKMHGQASAVLNIWKSKQPQSVLRIEQRKIQRNNEAILEKKISGRTTIKKQINKSIDEINQESQKTAKNIINKSATYKRYKQRIKDEGRKVIPKRKQVNKEKIKKEKDYRKERIEKYKKERGGTLQVGLGFTNEDIEFAGDMVASYMREGYYRLADITQKLIADFEELGINLTDAEIEKILAQEQNGEKLLVTIKKNEAEGYIPTKKDTKISVAKEKTISQQIDDVVSEHWSKQDELGRTLAEKFVDETGLTEKESNELANIVLAEYNKEIKNRSQKELNKLLGKPILPKRRTERKNVIDRITQAANLGALDSQAYQNLFGEYFGLKELSQDESRRILKLAENIQKLKGTGTFEVDAALELANYMYELYPKNRMNEALNTWIDMTYASLLSGFSTSILNMTSAGSNITLKPLRNALNVSKWWQVIRSGGDVKNIINPFSELMYVPALTGLNFGAKEAAKIYKKGGIGNKYIDQVANDKEFKISQLERPKYGEGKRFKPNYGFPIKIKIGGKNIDLNIFNLYKYSGRNLLAQDKLMYYTIHDLELVAVLADKFAKTGLRGKALTKAVIKEYTGRNIDQELFNQKLENDLNTYEEVTGKKAEKLDIEIRKREIMLDMLNITAEERAEVDQLARANIFTDDRGGLIAHVAYGIGQFSNKNVITRALVKPFVPFTKIVGNVTEYMLDYTPFYGVMRAHGLSVTGLYNRWTDNSLDMTAQMGEVGSRAYYEQMGRAWMGTLSFLTLALMGLGTDEDDWFQITGGYSDEGWQKGGRENVTPPYTMRFGTFMLPYKNLPALAIPLALIGNVNDRINSGMATEEIMERLNVATLAFFDTVTMTKDMSIVQGIASLTKLTTDILSTDENKFKSIINESAKRYLGFAGKPLPQNVNAVKQIQKFFDPTSYSRKDMKEILAYSAGVEHFVNNPSIDQLGDTVETYPGETLMPYTHWFGLKGGDKRWEFLAKYNSIPSKIVNTQKNIETIDTEIPFEKRRLDSDEFYEYTTLAGNKFSDAILEYMNTTNLSDRNKEKILDRTLDKELTGVQYDINNIRLETKNDAFTELFRWGVAKKEKLKSYNEAKKYDVLKPYQSSKSIDISINKRLAKYTLDEGELYRFNTLATLKYLELLDKVSKADKDVWKADSYANKYGVELNVLDEVTDNLWIVSKKVVAVDRNKYIDQEKFIEWKKNQESK